MTTGKTIALTIWTFVSKVMSLLCNMQSRFVIAFLPRSKCLLISWLQSPSAVILKPEKLMSITVSIVPHLLVMKWWDQMPWSLFYEYWALSQLFSLSSFTFIKRLFSSFLFTFCHKGGVICIWGLLIFLPAVLIPACASSSPAGFSWCTLNIS